MSNSNSPISQGSAEADLPVASLYRPHRNLPRPVSTVLDPLQPIPDRKKRLPLQILGVVAALLLLGMASAGVWLAARPDTMTVNERLLQGRTVLGDFLPEAARPLSTSKRVQAP